MKTTTMGRALALVVVVIVGAVPIAGSAELTQRDQEQLKAVMDFERVSNSYYLTIKNDSGDFLCLSTEQFDTGKGAISLHDADGKLAPLRSYREPGPPLISLGFNFSEPYIFLRPHENRKVYIDANNFIPARPCTHTTSSFRTTGAATSSIKQGLQERRISRVGRCMRTDRLI
jgi:hypothetical protein